MKYHENPARFGRRFLGAVSAVALAATVSACNTSANATASQCPPAAAGETFCSVVGLGGSIAAGYSAGKLAPDSPKDCWQTVSAFPVKLAEALGVPAHEYACSSATTENLLAKHKSHHQPPQLRLAKHAMKDALVVVFVGGNDGEWMQDQETCVREGCDAVPVKGMGGKRRDRLESNISTIAQDAYQAGAKKVLVLGYFGLGDDSCLEGTRTPHHRMTHRDYRLMNSWLSGLNGTLEAGAAEGNAQYVSSVEKFRGHGMCAPDPWVGGPDGLNGASFGHPNEAGQHELENLALQAAFTP